MKRELEASLQLAAEALLSEHGGENAVRVVLIRPRTRDYGDYAANVAMPLAGRLGMKPHEAAQRLLELVQWPPSVAKTEIAGPGFINIYLQQASEASILTKIVRQGVHYGRVAADAHAPSACVEFVSANPTGPMHVGHGRGAVVGDVLSSVMEARGVLVHREYYINDAGNQIGVLADSVWLRMRELQGESIDMPDECYPGEYVVDAARAILEQRPLAELQTMQEGKRRIWLGYETVNVMMTVIRNDLQTLGITFDKYFSEKDLHQSGKVAGLLAQLKADGLIYMGALPPPKGKEIKNYRPVAQWLFQTTKFGDDVDRPLAKKDGTPTYFAADIAYHMDKHERGFDRLVDVWGADHGGYVTRVQAAMQALTGKKHQPEVVLVQMVNLTRDGKPVRMSKRAGTFVTLREVVEEVGADAVRFNFLTRRAESQLDFDLETAKQRNDENPVYYVQYAHARVCSILCKADREGLQMLKPEDVDVSLLVAEEEGGLIKQLLAYPEVLEVAANRLEPYRVAVYLMQLAADLHRYYHKHRVIVEHDGLAQARLLLMHAVQQVLTNGLKLLGVSAPEVM
ncbi:MAG: arginine--tRNA ligase [Mariprofundaceae bacterium]|nr:arginine--tRNA ligase [Mariprofundaceae bacterium]